MTQPRKNFLICTLIPTIIATCALTTRGDAGQSEDPVGVWKLKCVSPDGKPRECVVTLFRERGDLKGTFTAGRVTRVAKGVGFDRGVLTFEVDGEFAGKGYNLVYKGRPRGDELRGTLRWTFGWASGSLAFAGERIPPKLAVHTPGESAG